MLPLGTMMHASVEKGVYGPASPTRLTRDEQARALPVCMLLFAARLTSLHLAFAGTGDHDVVVGHHARAALLWRPPACGHQRHVDTAAAECVPLALSRLWFGIV